MPPISQLQKSFDSVELPLPLKIAFFYAGVNGKGWPLIKSWYAGLGYPYHQHSSNLALIPRHIGRNVRQGSVLSQNLFIVLMDGLAANQLSGDVATTLEGLYVAGGLHADDTITVSNDKQGKLK